MDYKTGADTLTFLTIDPLRSNLLVDFIGKLGDIVWIWDVTQCVGSFPRD